VPPAGLNPEAVAAHELTWGCFIRKLQRRRSLNQQHPFVLLLFVPKAFWAFCLAGVDALQSPSLLLDQDLGGFESRLRTGPLQQAAIAMGGLDWLLARLT